MRVSSPPQCYLVGGAVRDTLLQLSVKDRDWVVVGSTPDQMVDLGFKPVGKDFPVFLHPQTKEEFALARTERKTARGYQGFQVWADPSVTLEQDLMRRDLTINAIAMTENGEVIDPYGGVADLEQRLLRHVSPAFVEDPLRVLRVARFCARFAGMGFSVAPETLDLMKQIVMQDELEALSAERVWMEIHGALQTPLPHRFIETLRHCGALQRILPEVDALFGVPQRPEFHPEIDTGVHTLMVLERAAELSTDARVRFAALVHDVGKALTPLQELPKHIDHENRGVPLVESICERLKVPRRFRQLATMVCRDHLLMHRLETLKPTTVVRLMTRLDVFRTPQLVEDFALACQADQQGRGGERSDYPQFELLVAFKEALTSIDNSDLKNSELTPARKAELVQRRRLTAIKAVIAG